MTEGANNTPDNRPLSRTITSYIFNGKEYKCRVVADNQGQPLIIGSLDLLQALHPGEFGDPNDGFASKEASDIYDDIFYFTEADMLQQPDSILIEMLKKEHPDFF